MWKKNLWTPLSPILRRRFPSFSLNSTLNIPSSTIFSSPCSSTAQYSRVFWSSSYDFLGSLKFSRKLCSAQSAEQVHVRCWNCKAAAQTTLFLACDSCRSVQPVDPLWITSRYLDCKCLDVIIVIFKFFQMEKKYELEDNNLVGKYKDWQKKLHPDLVHSKSEEEKEYAAEQSARVIDAYQTLSKPLARAIYILKLEGVDFDEEQTISDISFLAEIMEIREAVEEAANSETLLQIQSQVQEKLKHWSQSFSNAFQSGKFEEAVISVQRMTYYVRGNENFLIMTSSNNLQAQVLQADGSNNDLRCEWLLRFLVGQPN
ncbi:hypothetical protein AAG906_011121 [Vitis piasezkii]